VKEKVEFEGKEYWFYVEVWSSDAFAVAESVETGTEPSKTDPQYALHWSTVRWAVTEPGPYTFQFTNAYGRLATLGHLSLALTALPLPEDTGDTDDGPLADAVYESDSGTGGCGCGTSRIPAGLGWIGGLALLWRRRR
jgi:hypothetical protein